METTVPTIDAPESLKLVVFEKPTRSDQIVAAVTAAAVTVVATVVVKVGAELISHGLAARAAKKQARKDAEVQTTETETPDED